MPLRHGTLCLWIKDVVALACYDIDASQRLNGLQRPGTDLAFIREGRSLALRYLIALVVHVVVQDHQHLFARQRCMRIEAICTYTGYDAVLRPPTLTAAVYHCPSVTSLKRELRVVGWIYVLKIRQYLYEHGPRHQDALARRRGRCAVEQTEV